MRGLDLVEQAARDFFTRERLPIRAAVLGLSGGADSTALLYVLRALDVPVTAVHVHHGIRGDDADRDAAFCKELCRTLGVPFVLRYVDVPGDPSPGSIEEKARRLRYCALYRVCRETGAAYLAAAHNANDALETALWNLTRGTGAAGLGIAPVRIQDDVTLIRPLLEVPRDTIEHYLTARGQVWVTDATNLAPDVTRNRIRMTVIPALLGENPRALEHTARTFRTLREDDAALREYARALAVVPASAKALREAPRAVAVRAVRMLYGREDLTAAHIDAVLLLCASSDGSGCVDLPGMRVTRTYDALTFALSREAAPELPERAVLIPGVTALPEADLWIRVNKTKMSAQNTQSFHKIYVDSCAIHGILVCRARVSGDRFKASGSSCTKTLRRMFIDAKIPAARRGLIPVLTDGSGRIAAVYGFGVADGFAAQPGDDALEVSFESRSPQPPYGNPHKL
ncbi:MAG: tRNA lysidine(34) synthetase TilS [Clostridiales bacterium]|jgi:tRNA(Ile)-lysidine synthetase-like protein|nr:tRNA lysidine(34) synthetase TilS [Clostridiales bacterium]